MLKNRFLLTSVLLGVWVLIGLIGPFGTPATSADLLATSAATKAPPPLGDAARGKYLVQIAGCVGCHGTPALAGPQGVPLAGGREYKLDQLGTIYALNLTNLQDWTFNEFDLALRQGIDPYSHRVLAPRMPYMVFHNLSDSDLAAIGAYLVSLTPVDNDIPSAQLGEGMAALKPLPKESKPSPKMDSSAEYGKYLVTAVANCGGCHNPRDVQGHPLAGGNRNFGTDQSPLYPPAIIGSSLVAQGYTAQNFAATLRLGTRPRGALLNPAMPWRRFANMTTNDLTAVWNYLQTLKLDSPWPVQTAAPTAAPTAAATAAPTNAATAAATKAS